MSSSSQPKPNGPDHSGIQNSSSTTASEGMPMSLVKEQRQTSTTSKSWSRLVFKDTRGCSGPAFSCVGSNSAWTPTWKPSVSSSEGPDAFFDWTLIIQQKISHPAIFNHANMSEWVNLPSETAGECSNAPKQYSLPSTKLDLGLALAAVFKDEINRSIAEIHSIHNRSSTENWVGLYPHHCRIHLRTDPHKCPRAFEPLLDIEHEEFGLAERAVGTRNMMWPCPFFVNDQKSSTDCLAHHWLSSIPDVREHLCLMHRRPIYCSICYETFPTTRLRNIHMRAWECLHKAKITFEGITDEQVHALDEQQTFTDAAPAAQMKQWLEIWEVVFPSQPPLLWLCSFTGGPVEVHKLIWLRKGYEENIIFIILRNDIYWQSSRKIEDTGMEASYAIVVGRAEENLLCIELI